MCLHLVKGHVILFQRMLRVYVLHKQVYYNEIMYSIERLPVTFNLSQGAFLSYETFSYIINMCTLILYFDYKLAFMILQHARSCSFVELMVLKKISRPYISVNSP